MNTDSDRRGTLPPAVGTRHARTLRPYMWCSACAGRIFGRATGSDHRCACPARQATPAAKSEPLDHLLAKVTRMFNTQVLGADRANLVASCIGIAQSTADEPATVTTTPDPQAQTRRGRADKDDDLLAFLPGLHLDLAALPIGRLRRLLDAFDFRISYDPRRGQMKFHARISAILHVPPAALARLRVEVPADWPVLTPGAARALLRLLIHVADRREQDSQPPLGSKA